MRSLVLGLLAAAGLCANAHAQLDVEPAVPTPDGDTGFIGSVRVTFNSAGVVFKGKIFYTLNGDNPTQNSEEYKEAFFIDTTATLKSVRIVNNRRSAVHQALFTRKKLPMPAITYEGKPEFAGTKKVSLSVNVTVPNSAPNYNKPVAIYYTIDGVLPATLYSGTPITISKTCQLQAAAVHADYELSPVAKADFKLLLPAEKPVLNPKTGTLSKSQVVTFTSPTPNAYFQYSIGANSNPDSAGVIGTSYTVTGTNPGDVIVLRVVAKRSDMASSPVAEERYTWQPPAATPVISTGSTFFQDTMTVGLSTATAGATIYYTLNGLTPTPQTLKYNDTTKVRIDSSMTLKAIAFKTGQVVSDVATATYTLNLSAPYPNKGSMEFKDTMKVALITRNPKAKIVYTLEGQEPTLNSAQYTRGDSILIGAEVTYLRAMAILGEVKSAISLNTYTKKSTITRASAPLVEPAGQPFLDSIRVQLNVPDDPATAIYYTLNNEAKKLYVKDGKGLTFKANTVLRAIAFKTGLDSSVAVTETYTLVPAPPAANPPATQEFRDRVPVSLSTKTQGAVIRYMWDDQPFNEALAYTYGVDADTPLVLTESRVLKAWTMVGKAPNHVLSQPVTLHYVVLPGNSSDSIPPGEDVNIGQNMTLVNKGTAAISAKLTGFDRLDLKGFQDPSHAVTVSGGPGQPTPKVDFIRPDGQRQAVYFISSGGKPVLMGDAATVSVKESGTYFAAVDTLPPAVSIAGMAPKPNEGTTIKLLVLDNVSSTSCTVTGSGLPTAGITNRADQDGYLSFTLKNAAAEVKNLWFKATAEDARNTVRFPATGSPYCVAQAWSKLTTPPAWRMGLTDQPYDLAGFPIGSDTALTWAQIKLDNADPALTAKVYRGGPDYDDLQDADRVEPGMAFWLGSRNPRSSLILSKFQTAASPADGRFRMTVPHGWSTLTNPSLGVLYWPSARTDKDYENKRLRGLWAWDNNLQDYVPSDSLVPWRGYWVLNNTGADTAIEFLTAPRPVTKQAAKQTAGSEATVEILLNHGRPFPLRLGARSYARDGVGVEDEPLLPFIHRTRQGWSARDRDRLMTDVLHFSPDQVLRWKVVLEGAPAAGRDSMVSVAECRLPAGFEAWAFSPRRNLKIRLESGAGYSLPGPEADTLLVLAGPASKLASLPELAHAVESVDAFQSGPRMGRQGMGLFLALPADAWVKAELWSLSGRRLAVLQDGRLGSGQHFLPIPAQAGSQAAAFVRIRAKGQGWTENRVHKMSLRAASGRF